MLVNKTEKELTIIYNLKPITVKSKEGLDIRDFGLPSSAIQAVEHHIINKNPGCFDVIETKDVIETNKQALKEIQDLKGQISVLQKSLEEASKDDGSADIIAKLRNEIDGFKTIVSSLKQEKTELKAKLKAAQ